jgi:hypothetical protein
MIEREKVMEKDTTTNLQTSFIKICFSHVQYAADMQSYACTQ